MSTRTSERWSVLVTTDCEVWLRYGHHLVATVDLGYLSDRSSLANQIASALNRTRCCPFVRRQRKPTKS